MRLVGKVFILLTDCISLDILFNLLAGFWP